MARLPLRRFEGVINILSRLEEMLEKRAGEAAMTDDIEAICRSDVPELC